ncbi:hypothetical protein C1646_704047 [Rhizophagus diaphanus]|nr:hypothetical protein C1646_704047 [Rhizophagus diaphanus] [Rhizophagus sp. MUCL 43196]
MLPFPILIKFVSLKVNDLAKENLILYNFYYKFHLLTFVLDYMHLKRFLPRSSYLYLVVDY